MNRKETIPEPISQLHRQLEEYRRTRPRRAKLPDSLWDAAVELARQHGVLSASMRDVRQEALLGSKSRQGGDCK